MPEILNRLFSSDGFMPHGHCYLWDPPLVWLHVISDGLTALAYTSIPFSLVYFVRKRKKDIPFHWIFLCFGLFIVACGATHYMEIWTLWTPTYWLSGVIKAITAAASVPTAALLIQLMPKALAIPTPQQLQKAHNELSNANTALRAAVEARDDFLAAAGHELKTPLAAMLMHVQSLQRAARNGPDPNIGERLDKVATSGARLDKLINELLDVSRITAGRLLLEPEPLDLTDLLHEVVARFADAGVGNKATITLDANTSVRGHWDRSRIDQVITNLVANGLKYGRGEPIEIEASTEAESAVVRVTDHGIGMDADTQTKIFERFERGVSTREFGGLGLGLWISRQIVEASGGSIDVVSAPGKGATFTVRLPVDHSGTPCRGAS